MKTREETQKAFDELPDMIDESNFWGMTYEQGWEECLMWILDMNPEITPPTVE